MKSQKIDKMTLIILSVAVFLGLLIGFIWYISFPNLISLGEASCGSILVMIWFIVSSIFIRREKVKECKRHKWRVGSSNAMLKGKKIVKESLNIWCEKCDKKILAYYSSKIKFERRIKK